MDFNEILQKIADENNTTYESVKSEIEYAIEQAANSTDENVRKRFSEIPKAGEIPTVEEFLTHLLTLIEQ